MSPLLQAAVQSSNGCEKGNENTSYSRTDSGSDGAQGEHDADDGFISIECETILEEVSQEVPPEMAVS